MPVQAGIGVSRAVCHLDFDCVIPIVQPLVVIIIVTSVTICTIPNNFVVNPDSVSIICIEIEVHLIASRTVSATAASTACVTDTERTFPDCTEKVVVLPFHEIMSATQNGDVDAGVIIHESRFTFQDYGLHKIVDLGEWWHEQTGLPLPLGANAIRRDMGDQALQEVTGLLKQSIEFGLQHRDEALDYALGFGRGLDRGMADEFVGMYVNDWTLDFGDRGCEAVATLLRRGHETGVIPQLGEPVFIEGC